MRRFKDIGKGLILLLLVLTWGCATTNYSETAYTALKISKTSYDATMTTAGDLYTGGKITDETANQFIRYGDLYMNIHNEAVEGLLDYQMASLEQKPDAKTAHVSIMKKLADRLADLVGYLRTWKGGAK